MFGVPGAKGVVSSPPQPWIRFNDSPTPLESPLAHQPPLSHQYNQSSYHQSQQQQQQSKVSSLSPSLSDNFSPNENSNNISNGIQLANFDFNAASIEKDPKILHPVALRVSPDGQLITYDSSANNSGNSSNSNSSSSSSSNSSNNGCNGSNGGGSNGGGGGGGSGSGNSSFSGGIGIVNTSNCGPSSSSSSSMFLKSLPTTTCQQLPPTQQQSQQQPQQQTHQQLQQSESSISSIQSTASQSFQPLTGKKDLLLAPPPPPRPHRRPGHARSSSLDLNCLEKSLPSACANQGRKLIPNCFSNLPSTNAIGLTNLPPGVDRKGAFTVYRKTTSKDHSSTIRESTTKESNKWLEILKAKYHPPKPVQMPRSIYDLFQNKELVDYIQDLQERCYRLETMNNELIHKMANLMEDQSYFHHSHHSNHHHHHNHVDYKRLSK